LQPTSTLLTLRCRCQAQQRFVWIRYRERWRWFSRYRSRNADFCGGNFRGWRCSFQVFAADHKCCWRGCHRRLCCGEISREPHHCRSTPVMEKILFETEFIFCSPASDSHKYMESQEKRFIADVMLGRLAKWLRIIGYDTSYFRTIDDSQLIRTASREGRILLTRDVELYHRGGFDGLLIKAEYLEAQLAQVIKQEALKPLMNAGVRCPLCNECLRVVSREQIKELVPAYVWETHREFTRCPRCGKIFWRGTHWQRIHRRLREMGLVVSLASS